MIGARLLAIACNYEDCDDLDVLRFDPAFKLACGRLAETGRDLMSQPTLSRLENAPSWRELARHLAGAVKRILQKQLVDVLHQPRFSGFSPFSA